MNIIVKSYLKNKDSRNVVIQKRDCTCHHIITCSLLIFAFFPDNVLHIS